MDPIELLRQVNVFALLSLVIGAIPLVVGAAYAVRPGEAKLALMRPFSLAALFAAAAGTISGLTNAFRVLAASADLAEAGWPRVYGGLSEALVPAVFGLTCLSVAWLLVAAGMWRGGREG